MSGKINIPRVPLYNQHKELTKAVASENASYESFRPNQVFEPQYREMEGRATVSDEYRLRRYPSGELDVIWVANQVIDAIHISERGVGVLTPIQQSLLTVLFPIKFKMQEPQLAEIRTKMSDSEKEALRSHVAAHLGEEWNWAAGQGRGVGGKRTTL